MNWFYRPLAILIEQPWLALLPSLLLLAFYRATRKRLVLFAGLAWLGYFGYELGMKLRLLCSGECNIRIDLLAIYPLLLGFSLLAVILGLSGLRKNSA
jgi:hypothetical protein